jgi:outer membrane receptor for ferrienterochelin and colicins
LPDSSLINPYENRILGVFVQDDWKLTPKLTAQTGLRFDYHDAYQQPVLLPRLSLLYKFNAQFTSRLGGGLGYKAPTVFNNDIDERELAGHNLAGNIRTEKSIGANWDINFKHKINDWNFTINQMFYVTQIDRTVIADVNGGPYYHYINATKPLNTKGFETYVAAIHDGLEIYLGYTYTIAKQFYDTVQPNVPLSAKSKFAAVISNAFSSRFRACIEASYTGKQYLDAGTKTPGYLVAAAMVRYDIKKLSLVLNCENIFDYRQTRKESIVYGSVTNPSFKQIWAPVDGRVINLSARINF